MIRNYKLAANFNTVEFEITDDFIFQYYMENYDRHMWPEPVCDEDGEWTYECPKDVILKDILQTEYDILARIKVVNIAPDIKQAKQINPPSEKQAVWAENLGMKDPMNHDKKEVWAYIQKHKDD